jgi:hypothetical protein
MTLGQLKLLTSLTEAINDWSNKIAEEDDILWSEVGHVGDETDVHMANAAFAVLMAITEAQQYAVKEGYLKES